MDETSTRAGDPSRPGRRGVLRAAGVLGATAGAAAVSGCGASTSTPSPGAGEGSVPGGAGGGIRASDVPVGGGTIVPTDKVVVTQPVAGTFKAFDLRCPHQGCPVSMVTDDGIVCPCHGSVFDPATGQRRSGPARTGLTPRTVSADGEKLSFP